MIVMKIETEICLMDEVSESGPVQVFVAMIKLLLLHKYQLA